MGTAMAWSVGRSWWTGNGGTGVCVFGLAAQWREASDSYRGTFINSGHHIVHEMGTSGGCGLQP